jgi:hypothetical protein
MAGFQYEVYEPRTLGARTIDLLLAAKMGTVRRHHELLAEGR